MDSRCIQYSAAIRAPRCCCRTAFTVTGRFWGPSLISAIEEQLGLRLLSTKGPVRIDTVGLIVSRDGDIVYTMDIVNGKGQI